MQYCQSFVPNYPFPPIPTRESIINEGLKIFEQSNIDQQWLKIWLKRKTDEKKISSNHITLSYYRQKLIQHTHLLQQYEYALKNSNKDILFQLKTNIEQSNNFIYDNEILKNILKQIHQRKSKRARLRRQKQSKLIHTTTTNTNNIIIEKPSINEKSLIEKIQDINSLLKTIEQLINLRQQRQNNNNNNDNNELIEIQNLCNAKLLEYKMEMEKKTHSPHKELYNHLFNNHNQSFYESNNPDAQYFLRAHQNINDLIQIRQTWDQYSNTHSSSLENKIPFQWYEPQIPSDPNWAKFIFNNED